MSKELAKKLITENIMNKTDFDYHDYDSYIEDEQENVTEEEILEAFKQLEVEVKFNEN